MLDINLIREKPDLVRKALEVRQMDTAPVDQVLDLDLKRRTIIQQVETLKAERNMGSKEISRTKDPEERQTKIKAMRILGDQISNLDDELREVEAALTAVMSTFPNIPDKKTPYGVDESENVVLETVGEYPEFDFQPKPHWELGPELGIIDFERGVKMTGSRFYVLSGAGARLQRALIAFITSASTISTTIRSSSATKRRAPSSWARALIGDMILVSPSVMMVVSMVFVFFIYRFLRVTMWGFAVRGCPAPPFPQPSLKDARIMPDQIF